MEALSNAYKEFLVRWVGWTQRFAVLVAIAAVLLSVGSVVYLAHNIKINTSTTDMLSPDLPFQKQNAIIRKAFPQYSNNLLVVIDGDTPDLADDAAVALAEKLRSMPKLFGRVYDLASEPFFQKNGLLYLKTDKLADLGDRLADAQPFLGTLWQDSSLRGLFDLLGLVVDETLKGVNGKDPQAGKPPVDVSTVFNAIADVANAQKEGRFKHLSWQNLMRGPQDTTGDNTGKSSDKTPRRFLLIQPALDFGSLAPAGKAMKAVRRAAAEMNLDTDHGVRVRLSGTAALSKEELQSVEEGMGLAGILSLILVLGLLGIGLRSRRLIFATLLTLIMGLIWTAGFAILALGQLSLISVAFAVLFIGLSVDFGIHFGLRYKEAIDTGAFHDEALSEAARGVGGALTLAAIAAAIAFYSFLPTDYRGLAELGLIAGTGMFIAFFVNLTVLPALLTLMPVKPGSAKWGQGVAGLAQEFVRARAKSVVAGAVLLGVGAAALLPQVQFDFDPMNLRDPATESVSTLIDLMADSRTNPYSITILAESLDAAEALGKRLLTLPEVKETITLANFVPKNQDEKLKIIESMALYLSPAFQNRVNKMSPTEKELTRTTKEIQAKLGKLAVADASSLTGESAARLAQALDSLLKTDERTGQTLRELEIRLLSGLPNRLESLRLSLNAIPVELSDLPKSLRERRVAPDGRARLKVYGKGDMLDRDQLINFVNAVRTIAPNAVGSPVVILESGRAVVASFRDAGVTSVVLIGLLLVVLLRRIRDILYVFAPLLLAALLTVAASVLFNVPFNFANVIVLPLLFGLGVAGGIHLVLRERDQSGSADVLHTSTPRAVMFSALTTIGSFSTIALSSHPGTSSMGVLLSIAIVLTLICTLLVLPALMVIGPVTRDL
jgi:hopanoid biosynthesis associated RND transporter like protein HpnN